MAPWAVLTDEYGNQVADKADIIAIIEEYGGKPQVSEDDIRIDGRIIALPIITKNISRIIEAVGNGDVLRAAIATSGITAEPTDEELDQIYLYNLARSIEIDGHTGTISYACGGWGEIAITVELDGGDIIITKCERQSEDYEQKWKDGGSPSSLETYNWQRESDPDGIYYWTLCDAIERRSPTSAF